MTATKSPDVKYKTRTWYLVYHEREPFWFTRRLKPGFRHVELACRLEYGAGDEDAMWLLVLPTFEMLDIGFSFDAQPPWERCPQSTVQKVTTSRREEQIRSWFDIGPPSCVEIAKTVLGIRAFFVRTPYQLFKYIQKRNGVLINGRRRR